MNQRAWEYELDTMKSSIPVILEEEEQGWDFSGQLEKVENETVRMRWHSNVPGSGATEHVIIAAMQAMSNMGYDTTAAEALADEGLEALKKGDMAALAGHSALVWHRLMSSPKIPEHPYWQFTQYDSFEAYAAKVNLPQLPYDVDAPEFERLTHLGWQAQICAGAIGTAIEGYTTDNIRKAFGEIYGYVRTPNTYNDDITYELALLRAAKEKGAAVTGADIAKQWVALIPMGWSAEDVALRNLKLGVFPPESGKQNNPYREWIGAQMRGAICGMLFPGDAYQTARLAFMDGQISHHNNGVLGEVFNALLTCLAYVEKDTRRLVEQVVELIPKDSEYYSVVDFALRLCKKHGDWESAWRVCEKRFERYNWIHAYPNAAAEVIALWYGQGDFDETMHISAMQGYDVDCNAAQIGTVVAIQAGVELKKCWTEPIGDELTTYMRNIKQLSIRQLARETAEVARKMRT